MLPTEIKATEEESAGERRATPVHAGVIVGVAQSVAEIVRPALAVASVPVGDLVDLGPPRSVAAAMRPAGRSAGQGVFRLVSAQPLLLRFRGVLGLDSASSEGDA